MCGLQVQKIGIGVWVKAARPRQVPVGVPHLAADEKGGMKRDPVGFCSIEDAIENIEVSLVEAPTFGFDGRPQQVNPCARQSAFGHLCEGSIECLGAFAPRPVWT